MIKDMKKLHSLMMMYAAMGAMMPFSEHYKEAQRQLTPQELEQIERLREEKALERKLKQGLKKWDINGICVIALNRKNAERKAEKIVALLKESCA
ncbi:MAG TPA: hypothetical protein VE868_02075 [Balneolaceae bacterium]|nr:hypothetical protein [Balneolaceae bacterium]